MKTMIMVMMMMMMIGTRTRARELPRQQPLVMNEQCSNTKQGRHHITDNKGKICNWFDLDHKTGCCPRQNSIDDEYGQCKQCDVDASRSSETDRCCYDYESCVACCQDPKVSDALEDMRREPKGRAQQSTGFFADVFEHCKSKCRTQPTVTVHESTYGYEKRFCFGKFPRDKSPTPPKGFKPA
jgi:hypothetical protein